MQTFSCRCGNPLFLKTLTVWPANLKLAGALPVATLFLSNRWVMAVISAATRAVAPR